MTNTALHLAGDGAHGDSFQENQIPHRPHTTNAESTIPSPSAARLPPDDPCQLLGHHHPDQQAGTGTTILLPDFAQEIQLQESFNVTCRNSGLDENHAGEGEDPLTLDLIQRCINQEILQHPSMGEDCMVTSIQGAAVIEKERRLTSAEKEKKVESEATPRHQTTQFRTTTVSSITAHRNGECPTSREERGLQSPLFQYHYGPWRDEQRQQRQSPATVSGDEQRFHIVNPDYSWRHSRDKLQPRQPSVEEQRRLRYWAHVKGKCLNCFSTEHRVAHCRNNTKCWKCLNYGHKAFTCPSLGSRFKHQHDRKPHRKSLWSYGASDPQGKKRSYQEDVIHHNDRDFRPHRDDQDDDLCGGTRHYSHSAWGRASRCRDEVEDYYKSTRYLGYSHYGQYGYHNRYLSSPPFWGSSLQKEDQKLRTAKSNKRVSFANPLAQVLSESFVSTDISGFLQTTSNFCLEVCSARFDPMREELLISPTLVRHPTKEDYIRSMLCSPGWEPAASPERVEAVLGAPTDDLEEGEIREPTVKGATKDDAHEEAEQHSFSSTNKTTQVQTKSITPAPSRQGDSDLSHNQFVNTPNVQQSPITESLNCGEGNQIDDLAAFIDFISGPPPAPILNTPPRINPPQPVGTQPDSVTTQRKSNRLADKAKLHPGEDSIQLAQRVLINKLGELSPKEKVQKQDHSNFNKLAQHLPQPLTETNMAAIQTLIEKGNQPKRKKKTKIVPTPAAETVGQMT